MLRPEIAIFDLDNTLYSYKTAHAAAQDELVGYLEQKTGVSRRDIEVGLIISRGTVKERLGDVAASHSRLLYISEYLRSTLQTNKSQWVLEAEQVYWQSYFLNMKLYDQAAEFMANLRLSGCQVILVSDLTLQVQLKKLLWLRIDSYFDSVFSSEELRGDKKTGHPELLLKKYIDPRTSSIWTIGDSSHDHLFSKNSVFFHKKNLSRLREVAANRFEFSRYSQLLKLLISI